MPGSSILSKTEVTIQGYNNDKPLVFSNLSLSEALINVNSFSFSIKPADTNSSFSSIIDFKKKVLGKNVLIEFKDGEGKSNHKFNGVVLEVNSSMVDEHHYEFYITGSGIFCKVNEIAECHSFYKKKLDAIIDKAFEKSALKDKVNKNTQTTKELHYIVQYNQSLFSFISSLAIRFGEWMFYDGENLQFGKKPEGESLELKSPGDVANLNIRAQAVKKPEGTIATDIFKSDIIKSGSEESAPDNDFIRAVEESGKKLFENPGGSIFLASGFNQAESDDKYRLEQQAIMASSVFITGTSRNNKISIGKKIKIKDATDNAGRSFIITQIQHYSTNYSNYSNSFTAVPIEVDVPPYTNPMITPKAKPQAAIITDNEDDAGMARVKVKFPWMADDEKTPWISVLVPHAGKDKGFRFLPEKDDEVMVDFWDSNAETPFVNGSLYTEKNKSGIGEKKNNIKMIGTRSGRRIEIDDKNGVILIKDHTDEGGNSIRLIKNDSGQSVVIFSVIDDDNFSALRLIDNRHASLEVRAGGESVAIVTLDGDNKTVELSSKKDIKISSDSSISLKSAEINLNAKKIKLNAEEEVKIDGKQKTEIKGKEVKLDASTTLEAKGLNTTLQGNTQVNVKGGGTANITAAIVNIN